MEAAPNREHIRNMAEARAHVKRDGGCYIRPEFLGDETEGVPCGGLGGDPVELLLNRGIDAFDEGLARRVALDASLGERDRREGAKREHLLDAGEAVPEPPELMTIRQNEIEAVAVRELERLFLRRD